MESLDVPDWDFTSSASAMYPSLEASGKVQSKRGEEKLLQKLIQGTVRFTRSFSDATEAAGEHLTKPRPTKSMATAEVEGPVKSVDTGH